MQLKALLCQVSRDVSPVISCDHNCYKLILQLLLNVNQYQEIEISTWIRVYRNGYNSFITIYPLYFPLPKLCCSIGIIANFVFPYICTYKFEIRYQWI